MFRRRFLGAITVPAIVLSVGVGAAAAAPAPISWGSPIAVDVQPPFANAETMRAVSCLPIPLCVAGDERGNVVTSTDPTGGATAWHVAPIPGTSFLVGSSCASGPFCAVIGDSTGGGAAVATSTNPTGGSAAWNVESISISNPQAISCASSSFCAAVDNAGNVWTSTDPTNASSWSSTAVDAGQTTDAISCPTTSLCMVTDQGGDVVYSTNPTGGAAAWVSTNVAGAGDPLDAVSCLASGECWASDGAGSVWHSNGSTYTSAWTAVSVDAPRGLFSLSCSASACAAGDANGNVVGTDNPTSNVASDWNLVPAESGHTLYSASCISSTCVVVGDGGNVLDSADPGAGSWTVSAVDGTNPLVTLSCPSVSLCVVPDTAGRVLTSTDPTGGAGAWQRTPVDNDGLVAASCPSVSLCVLGDNSGNILTSTNPTGGAGAWSQPVHLATQLTSLSCPSVSECVAVWDDTALSSTDPTGGAGQWSSASIDPGNTLEYVTCPTTSLCVAVDDSGGILTSTDPTGGPNAWHRANVAPGDFFDAVACVSASLCVAVDDNGAVFMSTDPTSGAGGWSSRVLDRSGNGFQDITCRPGPICIADDFAGNVWTSTDPADAVWSAPQNIDGSNFVDTVKCSPGLLCLAADDVGNLIVGTPVPPTSNAPPTIAGQAVLGQQLTESHAGWGGDPISFAYQWEDCDAAGANCAAIAGATGQTYTVGAADAGHTIRVQETAANAGGTSAPAVSAPTSAVPSPAGLVNIAAPVVSGARIVGQVLRAGPGTWSGPSPIAYGYQWQTCRASCTNVSGATGSTYRLRKGDRGARIRVVVSAGSAGSATSADSAETGRVLALGPIRDALRHAVVPHGRSARYAAVLAARGFTATFRGLVSGRVHLVWKSRGVLLGAGTVRFADSGRHRLRLRLTRAGRRDLAAHAGKLIATVTFTPAGGQAITFSERFTLR